MTAKRVLLIDTAEPDRTNDSMGRYGRMVREALQRFSGERYWVETLNLSPTRAWLDHFPASLRMPLRYGCIAARARCRLSQQPRSILHLLDGSHAYLLRALPRLGAPLVITVHDLIPLLRLKGVLASGRPGRAGAWIARQSVAALRRADVLVADSASTGTDLVRYAHVPAGKVQVAHPAVAAPDALARVSQSPDRYILNVAGHNAFYKNRVGVIDVFSRIHASEPVRLILAGAPPDAALLERIRRSGAAEAITFAPGIAEESLRTLYGNAAFLLFPSLYEGFGWPPLEAMSAGCPVVCSNAGSLPEIVGEAALMAAPGDVAALAGHGLRLLQDPEFRDRLIAAGRQRAQQFSLNAFSERLVSAYQMAETMAV